MSAAPVPARRGKAGARSVGRSTVIFATWTAISRVVGLIREIAAAAIYGTRGPITAFVVAFQVPNLLRSLVADSALSAAFVPVFTDLQERGLRKEAQRLAGALAGLITLGLGAICIVAVVLAPYFMPLIAPGVPEEFVPTMVRLSQIMFPIVVVLGLTGLVVGILQSAGEFGASAFVPVLWNGVILIALGFAPFVDGNAKIYVYAGGIVAGTIAQFLFLLPFLRGKGPFPLGIGFRNPYVKRVLVLMLPVTVGLGLINVNALVDTGFASLVSDDAVRAIDAAFRLYILPQGIFSVAISTVLFPTISRLAARADIDGMRRTVAGGLRQIFFMLLPATAFLMVLAEPIVRLVFQHGNFDATSTSETAEALFYFTLGLVFNGASLLLIRTLFSLQLPWLATKVALGAMVLNALLDLALYRPLGTGGIPLSTSISSLASFLALYWYVSGQLGGLEADDVADGFMRSAAAAAFLALLSWCSWRVLDDALGRSIPAQLVSLAVAMAVGTVGFLSMAQALGMPELRTLARMWRPLR